LLLLLFCLFLQAKFIVIIKLIWLKMQQLRINPAQYEILNVLSCVDKEEDVAELKSVIVQFLNSRLQKEINRLWDDGTLNEGKVEAWADEHMRTSYK